MVDRLLTQRPKAARFLHSEEGLREIGRKDPVWDGSESRMPGDFASREVRSLEQARASVT